MDIIAVQGKYGIGREVASPTTCDGWDGLLLLWLGMGCAGNFGRVGDDP
jgi:hypothetical protein